MIQTARLGSSGAQFTRLGLGARATRGPWRSAGAPLEGSWGTMRGLVDEGKARWIGVPNCDAERLERGGAIHHVDSFQPPLSMLQRGGLRDLIPSAAANGTGVIVYSPMASGLL